MTDVTLSPAPPTSAAKSPVDPTAAEIRKGRRYRHRINAMLAGAKATGVDKHFRGPVLDFARLTALSTRFAALDDHDAATLLASAQGTSLSTKQRRAEAKVEGIREYLPMFYPPGADGRSLFFVPPGGAKAPEDELDACNRGLLADAADKDKRFMVGLPDCDPVENAKLVADIRKGVTAAQSTTTSREATRSELVQIAHQLRDAAQAAEKLIRKVHGNDAALLAKHGLKPLGAIRPRNPRAKKAA